ncbi:hypothetical protein EYF80_029238 [Liparis tanakae]|uniref:Uncharacterized protein n=1 Tax=Liparis tanakae TaxID=230148 RepID=A0A4Z2H5F4_9TELE|nr:hypothetical protein EYF80_029238 [Liparis tanakae]
MISWCSTHDQLNASQRSSVIRLLPLYISDRLRPEYVKSNLFLRPLLQNFIPKLKTACLRNHKNGFYGWQQPAAARPTRLPAPGPHGEPSHGAASPRPTSRPAGRATSHSRSVPQPAVCRNLQPLRSEMEIKTSYETSEFTRRWPDT